ncbi:MAG TPA: PAS domain-containing protein [Candidatus Acidoferrum sp.]|nr:PAS domain-containing protein [Candidatus Acidoferrum sp.]
MKKQIRQDIQYILRNSFEFLGLTHPADADWQSEIARAVQAASCDSIGTRACPRTRGSLAHSLAEIGAGAYAWDMGLSPQAVWDERFGQLHGLRELVPFDRWLLALHPEDRPMIRQHLEALHKDPTAGDVWDVQYRVVGADGSVRWLVSVGRIQRDKAGVPMRMTGIVTDVSHRRGLEPRVTMVRQSPARPPTRPGGQGSRDKQPGPRRRRRAPRG